MAKVHDRIDERMATWIEAQPIFFVATAPLAEQGRVNVSPKGTVGTFRVLDDHTFSYADLTGSGAETVAHLRENGRICVMFCSFDGAPNIVRLHGTGRVVLHDEPGFDEQIAVFGAAASDRSLALRAVITVDVARISDACGYAVPRMDLVEERDVLDSWTARKTPETMRAYRDLKNTTSLDGLPGLNPSTPAAPVGAGG